MKWAAAFFYAAVLIGFALYLLYLFIVGELDKADKVAGVAGGFVALLGVPPGIVALVRLWQRQRSTASLDEVAGQLAVAVRNQWDAEAERRRLNDPYPLPVAWRTADEDLAESWPLLQDMAHAWPGGPPGHSAQWAESPAGLAGEYARIGEVFTDRVPTRRLLVLGEPGAGKSALLMKLLQDLLAHRTGDDPVPVLFSLASWNPDQPLKVWLADQLRRNHPGLRDPAPANTTDAAGDRAEALLETRRILPLLDGFDELPSDLHHRALDAINRTLAARQPLVLAARAASYRTALNHPGPTVRLNGAAAIQLLPLSAETSAAYLRRDAGGDHTSGAARWDTVAAQLGTDSPIGQALSTPLGLFLARTIYNPRPSRTSATEIPHPDELGDAQAFPDRAAVDQHLFKALIPAVYAPDGPHPPRWNAAQAHRTFVTLAHFLETQRNGSPDLAWWEIKQAFTAYVHSRTSRRALVFAVVLAVLLAVVLSYVTLSWLVFWPVYWLNREGKQYAGMTRDPADIVMDNLAHDLTDAVPYGLTAGLMVGLVVRLGAADGPGRGPDSRGVGQRWSPLGLGLTVGPAVALMTVLAIGGAYWLSHGDLDGWLGNDLTPGLMEWLATGLINGLMFGLTVGLTAGVSGGPDSPSAGLRWSPVRLAAGFGLGLAFWILIKLLNHSGEGMGWSGNGFMPIVLLGLLLGLGRKEQELTSSIGPAALLRSDRRTFITFWLGLGLALGPTVVLIHGLIGYTDEFRHALASAFSGALKVGIWFGLLAGLGNSTWPYFTMVRAYLAARRKAPLRLMSFLQDAHEHRSILRQVGPVYQFRHIDLQRYLAQQHPLHGRRTLQGTPPTPERQSIPRRGECPSLPTDTP